MFTLLACSESKTKIDQEFVIDIELEDKTHDSINKILLSQRRTSAPTGMPVILLDFDGHTTSGTMWNVNGDFTVGSSGLNPTQQQVVLDSVKRYYRQWDALLLVTNDERKYRRAPEDQRIRIVITVDNEFYCTNCGGSAYINSFTWLDETPAFVFSELLGFNVKKIADASAHEAGHALALRHQSRYDSSTCVRLEEYHSGFTGEISWAPIMGNSYNNPTPRFITGTNSIPDSITCGRIQNDTLIIKSKLQ